MTEWRGQKKVLCVRLDSLGDVLMITPAVRAVRETVNCHIPLLTSPEGEKIARLVPVVDDVIATTVPWMKHCEFRKGPEPEEKTVKELQSRQFDAAVIFTSYSQSALPAALLCYLAGIPLRLAHCRENPYQLLTDWVKESEPHQRTRHEVMRQLELVASVGCSTKDKQLVLSVPRQARQGIFRHLRRLDPCRPWAVVHAGASASSRRYAPERFRTVVSRLTATYGLQIVLTGSTGEFDLVADLALGFGPEVMNLAGMLDLPELCALLSEAPLLISNNTGPVHIAAAVGTPVVDIYALTNPQHTPWHVRSRVLSHDVPCKYCYKSVCPLGHNACLEKVTPDEVVHAALELLGQGTGSQREFSSGRINIPETLHVNTWHQRGFSRPGSLPGS